MCGQTVLPNTEKNVGKFVSCCRKTNLVAFLTSVDPDQHVYAHNLIWICISCITMTEAFRKLLINSRHWNSITQMCRNILTYTYATYAKISSLYKWTKSWANLHYNITCNLWILGIVSMIRAIAVCMRILWTPRALWGENCWLLSNWKNSLANIYFHQMINPDHSLLEENEQQKNMEHWPIYKNEPEHASAKIPFFVGTCLERLFFYGGIKLL